MRIVVVHTAATVDKPRSSYADARSELSASVRRLSAELRECLEAVLPTLDGARACGRALGLKRQLGWSAYTVATSSDLPSVLAALPRRAGWAMIMDGLRAARCPERKVKLLAGAVDEVMRSIDPGRMSKAMLRSLAAGRLDSSRQTAALLRARRAMREAASRIYGVRCAAQVGTFVLGPAHADGWVNVVTWVLHEGLERLRPGPPVALKWLAQAWHPAWKDTRSSRPLGASARHGWLVADLSTPGAWERYLRIQPGALGPVVYFETGAEFRTKPVRTVFAELLERGGTVGSSDDMVDLHVTPLIPTRLCVFEVWIHRSLRVITEPAASLRETPHLTISGAEAVDMVPLPLEAQATSIAEPTLPSELSSANAAHAEMLTRAAKALGAAPSDFVGHRVVVPDPPTGASVSLRWRM